MTQPQAPVAHTLDGLPIFPAQRVPEGQAQPWGVTDAGDPIWHAPPGDVATGGPAPLGILSNGQLVYGTMDVSHGAGATPLWRKKRVLVPLALVLLVVAAGAVAPDEPDNPAAKNAAGERSVAPLPLGGGVQQAAEVEAKRVADAAAAKQAADAATAKSAADAAAAKSAADAAAVVKQAADAAAVKSAADAAVVVKQQAADAAAAKQAAAAAAQRASSAAEPEVPTAKRFANCADMQGTYPHGVGRPGAVDSTAGVPVTTFTRSAVIYEANSGSDRDDDGIACEKR
jgi:hypothetical protein